MAPSSGQRRSSPWQTGRAPDVEMRWLRTRWSQLQLWNLPPERTELAGLEVIKAPSSLHRVSGSLPATRPWLKTRLWSAWARLDQTCRNDLFCFQEMWERLIRFPITRTKPFLSGNKKLSPSNNPLILILANSFVSSENKPLLVSGNHGASPASPGRAHWPRFWSIQD